MEVVEEKSLVAECSISSVLNNFDLVEKILEEVTDDMRSNMQLRLVNRTFRDACHVNLQKTHRNLKIEHINLKYLGSRREFTTTDQIHINHCRFKLSNLDNYFHFLTNIAKVKIQSIVLKGLWQLAPSIRKSLQESIRVSLIGDNHSNLKKLIGMDEICPRNCEDCTLIPTECVEYGPLQIESLRKSFEKPRAFEKLIIADYLLDDIANSCMESTESRNDCLKSASGFISSNISCKTLILQISETRAAWFDTDEQRRMCSTSDHQPMPREVIELMLKQWKVESVVLKFVYKVPRGHAGEWIQKDWFTRLCFKDHYTSIKESDPSFKIKEVFVDLTDSLRCNAHLREIYVYGLRTNSYVHLPSKIKRVFLNDKLKIKFSHYRTGDYYTISRAVGDMINIINTEARQNFEVEIMNMYLVWKTDINYFDELSKMKPHLRPVIFRDYHISELPKRIDISHKTLKHEDQPLFKKEWMGRNFRLTNRKTNCTINWTMLENENLLYKNQ